jgi:hypothetical protein
LPAFDRPRRKHHSAFGPDEHDDGIRGRLALVDRDDPATLMVGKRIFELAKRGGPDPLQLREAAVKQR